MHKLAALAAKNQSVDNHAALSGLVALLIFGGVLAVVMSISGAIDEEYSPRVAVIGVMLAALGGFIWKIAL